RAEDRRDVLAPHVEGNGVGGRAGERGAERAGGDDQDGEPGVIDEVRAHDQQSTAEQADHGHTLPAAPPAAGTRPDPVGTQPTGSTSSPVSRAPATAPTCMTRPTGPSARAPRRAGSQRATEPLERGRRPARAPPMPSRVKSSSGNPARAPSPPATDQPAANR